MDALGELKWLESYVRRQRDDVGAFLEMKEVELREVLKGMEELRRESQRQQTTGPCLQCGR